MAAPDASGRSVQPWRWHRRRRLLRPYRAQPQSPPPGELVAKVKAALVEQITAAGVPGDPKDHARQIWDNAEVKADGKWITDALELDVLKETARTYLDDLAAVNA